MYVRLHMAICECRRIPTHSNADARTLGVTLLQGKGMVCWLEHVTLACILH